MSIACTVVLGATDAQNAEIILELVEDVEELKSEFEDSAEEERSNEDDYRLDCHYFSDLVIMSDSQMHKYDDYNDIHTLLIVPPPER